MYKYLSLLVFLAVATVVLAEKQDLETAQQFYQTFGYYPDYYFSLARGFPNYYPGYAAAVYVANPYPAPFYPGVPQSTSTKSAPSEEQIQKIRCARCSKCTAPSNIVSDSSDSILSPAKPSLTNKGIRCARCSYLCHP